MKEGTAGKAIYRKDYTAYPWNVEKLDLHFDIEAETTMVRASMSFSQKDTAAGPQDIVLNGSDLELISMVLNGCQLTEKDYVIEGETLTIPSAPQTVFWKPKSVFTRPRIPPSKACMFPVSFC